MQNVRGVGEKGVGWGEERGETSQRRWDVATVVMADCSRCLGAVLGEDALLNAIHLLAEPLKQRLCRIMLLLFFGAKRLMGK